MIRVLLFLVTVIVVVEQVGYVERGLDLSTLDSSRWIFNRFGNGSDTCVVGPRLSKASPASLNSMMH